MNRKNVNKQVILPNHSLYSQRVERREKESVTELSLILLRPCSLNLHENFLLNLNCLPFPGHSLKLLRKLKTNRKFQDKETLSHEKRVGDYGDTFLKIVEQFNERVLIF